MDDCWLGDDLMKHGKQQGRRKKKAETRLTTGFGWIKKHY